MLRHQNVKSEIIDLQAVSLDGTMFHKSGIISGGTTDLTIKAKRWDEKEMDRLKSAKNQMLEEMVVLKKSLRKESELKAIRLQIEGNQTRIKYIVLDRDGVSISFIWIHIAHIFCVHLIM